MSRLSNGCTAFVLFKVGYPYMTHVSFILMPLFVCECNFEFERLCTVGAVDRVGPAEWNLQHLGSS